MSTYVMSEEEKETLIRFLRDNVARIEDNEIESIVEVFEAAVSKKLEEERKRLLNVIDVVDN